MYKGEVTMDLELRRDTIDHYELVLDTTVCQEGTQEAIVPDSCPDILRIVDTCAQAFLTGKQVRDGSVTVSGQVKACVMYLPEGGGGLCRMEIIMPFTSMAECTGLSEQGMAMAVPRVRWAQAKMLNPRKVLLRTDLAVDIQGYEPRRTTVCIGVSEEGNQGIQQLVSEENDDFTVAVQEKPFTFSEAMDLGFSGDGDGEVIALLAQPCGGESKLIGSKLLLKGTVEVEVLLRDGGGTLKTVRQSMNFSQIMEVPEAGENNSCQVRFVLTGVSLEMGGDPPGTAELTLDLLAQAEVSESRPVRLLQDLYSTGNLVETKEEEYLFHTVEEQGTRTVPVRELVECTTMVHTVVDCWADLEGVHAAMEGKQTVLNAQVQVCVLYLDDGDELQSAHKTITVPCRVDNASGMDCRFWCAQPCELFAAPAAGGVEVRFSLDFHFSLYQDQRRNFITSATLGAERQKVDGERPSVVLRMAAPGERLWDIAKIYGTTTDEIISANGLEEGALPAGRMLLIPHVR